MNLREIGKSVGGSVLRRVGRVASRVQESQSLPVDVLESDEEYLIVFDAPGAEKSDVQVRYVDDSVRVRIDRFRDFHEGFEMRFPGRGLSLTGRADLPDDAVVDPEAATATLTRHGTLEVQLPKAEDDTVAVGEPSDVAETDTSAGASDEPAADDEIGGEFETASEAEPEAEDTVPTDGTGTDET